MVKMDESDGRLRIKRSNGGKSADTSFPWSDSAYKIAPTLSDLRVHAMFLIGRQTPLHENLYQTFR